MGRTLPPPRLHAKYGTAGAVVPTLAIAEGRSAGGVHAELHGPVGAVAKVDRYLRIAVATGHRDWAARLVERFSAIVRRASVAPPLDDVIDPASKLDLDEEWSQHRFERTRATADLERWGRDLERDLLAGFGLLDSINAELERRGAR